MHFGNRTSEEEAFKIMDCAMGSSNLPGWGLSKFQAAPLKRGSLGLIRETIQTFPTLCSDQGESPVAVAIAWMLAQLAISSAIVGIRKLSHLDDKERASELVLGKETLEQLNELFDTNKGCPIRASQTAPEAFAW
jgi:diketogulonate reductase-like aldo/keto reductase